MNTTNKSNPAKEVNLSVHHGQNIKRIRLLLGLPQKVVAARLGAGWTQKKVSRIESRPHVIYKLRQELAKLFEVDIDLFDEFDEAVGRLALMHIMKFRKQGKFIEIIQEEGLMEDLAELFAKSEDAMRKEEQNIQLILRLIRQMKTKTLQWADNENPGKSGEVKEPAVLWRVV